MEGTVRIILQDIELIYSVNVPHMEIRQPARGTDHLLPSNAGLRMRGSIPLLPLHACMTCTKIALPLFECMSQATITSAWAM
jgi:hypothetical protein